MLHSAIYAGLVTHQRFAPKAHGFRYHVFMMYLDLDELPQLFDGYKHWSYQHKNWASFRRADYYGNPELALKQEISDLVAKATGTAPRGAIRMLTNMRYFGHCFNPVTFYYCFAADGESLQAIVSHITNTPWGDDYAYVHDFNAEKTVSSTGMSAFKLDKSFHVSPFMPMDIEYDWAFKLQQPQLLVHMKNLHHGELVFNATLNLQRQEISEHALNRILISYPFMTIKVVAAIYWNALLLWFKRTPFYSRPTPSP